MAVTSNLQEQINEHANSSFDSKCELAMLAEQREINPEQYWQRINDIRVSDHNDLDIMLGRPFVKIKDGSITYKYKEIFGGNAGKIVETTRESLAQTLADELTEVIEYIQNESQETFDKIIDEMSSFELRDLIMNLKVVGNHEELINQLLQKIEHTDDLVLAVFDCRRKWQDNEYDLADYKLIREKESLVSAYIQKVLPVRDPTASNISEDDSLYIESLKFAQKYGVESETLEYIALNAPLPSSIIDLHIDSSHNLKGLMFDQLDLSERLLELKNDFETLYDEEKLGLGQSYLNLLCAAYGIYPPPPLELDTSMTSAGSHTQWESPEVAETHGFKHLEFTDEAIVNNIKHPMGRVKARSDSTFGDFIETISHEFIHSLEDLSAYCLNSKFMQLVNDPDDQTLSISDNTLAKVKSMGVLTAFNSTAVCSFNLFNQTNGVYFPSKHDENDEKHQQDKYRSQIRERHAYLMESFIAKDFISNLERIEKTADPVHIFMKSQHLSFKVKNMRSIVQETITLDDEERKTIQRGNKIIENLFSEAYDRTKPYSERLNDFKKAFTVEQKIMRHALSNCSIENTDTREKIQNHWLKLGETIEDLDMCIRQCEVEAPTPNTNLPIISQT